MNVEISAKLMEKGAGKKDRNPFLLMVSRNLKLKEELEEKR